MSAESGDADFELLIPFVIEDIDEHSLALGWECGAIHAALRMCAALGATPPRRYVHTEAIQQIDLLAMEAGFTTEVEETDETGEWTLMGFIPAGAEGDE